jgi:hypothetical protein
MGSVNISGRMQIQWIKSGKLGVWLYEYAEAFAKPVNN